jgi:hypothetical protein
MFQNPHKKDSQSICKKIQNMSRIIKKIQAGKLTKYKLENSLTDKKLIIIFGAKIKLGRH